MAKFEGEFAKPEEVTGVVVKRVKMSLLLVAGST